MAKLPVFAPVALLLFFSSSLLVSSYDGPVYDSTAYTECKPQPEPPLYGGAILKDQAPKGVHASFPLNNLQLGIRYCFSAWAKTNNVDTAMVQAQLRTENTTAKPECIGSVTAKKGCWSFLKGGFILRAPSNTATIFFSNSSGNGDIGIEVASVSLQPFTEQEWRFNQDIKINETRNRAVTLHVSDKNGVALQGAAVRVELVAKDFPFGSAIADTILGNPTYQKWFVERFNTAVFEDQLKWYATEIERGQVNYTIPDQMLQFARSNQIMVRGHNVVWTKFGPDWTQNLTGAELEAAVNSRVESVMNKYKNEFINWDVNNEMMHSSFLEERIRPSVTLDIYKKVHEVDPLTTLFMNEYNVVERYDDRSTVDAYIAKLNELKQGGVTMGGIGLQSHFGVPNLPLMRGVLDKFATLGLPIWLTEVDISNKIDKGTVELQALYLEEVLREGFSHPAVDAIVLWTALRQGGCYKMCLTDTNYNNLPTGDVVDKLLQEWDTKVSEGRTDDHGSYSFFGSLGEYKVTAKYEDKTFESTFSLPRGKETKHLNIQLQGQNMCPSI